MRASAWQRVLLVLCFLFVTQEAMTIYWLRTTVAASGVSVTGSVAPFRWELAIAPDSPAYDAGLRTGDVFDASALSGVQRFRLLTAALSVNEPLQLTAMRNGQRLPINLRLPHFAIDPGLWLAIFAGFWAGACAFVLLLRKPTRDVFLLVAWLLLMRLNIQMNPVNWVTGWPAGDLVNALLDLCTGLGWPLLAHYALGFLDRPNRAARVWLAVSYVVVAAAIVVDGWALLAAWYGFADPAPTQQLVIILWALVFIAPVACGISVFRSIRGPQREQLGWTLCSGALYGAIYTYFNITSIVPSIDVPAIFIPVLVLQLVTPALLTYAMLNRRLLDLGFALNRAAVYTGVSLVVVGLFMLAEWAFGAWFSSATHVENTLASSLVALVLGFSVRGIHQRVDLVLDSLFFRKRHEDERALHAFAHDAPFVTDAETLVARTVQILEERADAAFARVLLRDGTTYDGIDENDETFVALRSRKRIVDLHTVRTRVEGEFAFPMVARGELVGAIALGPKRSGESYAPDESSAIALVAQSVGTSLDVLGRAVERQDALSETVSELQRTVAALVLRLDGTVQR